MLEKGIAPGLPDRQVPPVADPVNRPPVAAVPFLQRLEEEERVALLAAAQLDHCPADVVVCREGDPAGPLFIIQIGLVAVLKEVEEGRPVLLGYLGAGEILGEMSLVSQQPRSASVVTVEDSALLRVEEADFRRLTADHPGINRALLSVLSDRLYEADVARTTFVREERGLAQRLQAVTGEAERLAEMAHARRESLELLVHDLRTPLTIIDGCLDSLELSLSADMPPPVSQLLEIARRSTRRLGDLSEGLLETARREASTGEDLGRRPLNIAALLASTVEGWSTMAQGADLELELHAPPDLPQPCGDPAKVQRVLDNLLENAVSYTPCGGRILIAAQPVGSEMEISISDTGPGVPAELRQAIFERFVRLPNASARRQGLGLGLYFCRQVVQAHGGRIWIEPGPGNVGSRFVFTLPLGKEAAGA
jgi:signal transduction histidine kinase